MEEWREVYAEKGSITAGLERRGKKEKKKRAHLRLLYCTTSLMAGDARCNIDIHTLRRRTSLLRV
jgi:hypothetical protein